MTGKNNSSQGAAKKGKAILHSNSSRTFKNLSAYAGIANTSAMSKHDIENAAAVGSLNKKVVVGKRLADFAPAAAKVAIAESSSSAAAAASSSSTAAAAEQSSSASAAAVTDVNVFHVMQAARLCENTVNRDMRRVVSTIATTPAVAANVASTARIVRRIVCKGKRDRQNGIILGTCELAAKAEKDIAILVVEPTDDDARRLAALYATMGVPAALIVDDAADAATAAASSTKRKSQNPALSALAAPIVADPKVLKRNKFLQLAAANRNNGSVTTAGYSQVTDVSSDITFALAKAPKVGVTSLASIFTCVNDQHARQYAMVIVDEPQPRDEELYATLGMMLSGLRNVHVVASTPELALNACVAPLCGSASSSSNAAAAVDEDEASSSNAFSKDLPVSFVTTEGLPRLQTLLALLQNSGRNNKIVVQCATQDCAIFLCDLLFALNSPEEGGFRLFCDSENKDDKAQLAIDVATIAERFDKVTGGAVLLTAHGLLPKSGTLLVQYDPIVSMMHFVSNLLAPAAANVAAYQNYQSEVVAAAAANGDAAVTTPFTAPAAAKGYAYRHIIVFFYPTEEAGALTLIADALRRVAAPNNFELRPEQIKPVSVNTAAATLLTIQSVKELHKKVFAIQNNAYNAYRSLMQVYSRLHPKTVFNVDALNLDAVAAQFGYEELPLLDLRTKNTQFRPKLDVYRAAIVKSKGNMKRIRNEAEANVVGAGPDEEWMKDAKPFTPREK